jgi:hypothetical protein
MNLFLASQRSACLVGWATSNVSPLLQRGVRGDFFNIKSLSVSLFQREKLKAAKYS